MKRNLVFFCLGTAVLACLGGFQSMGYAQSQEHTSGASLEANKALVRRWIEKGFNTRDLTVVDQLFVEDFPVNERKIGRAALKQNMSRRFSAFPDLHVTITELLAEGNKVVVWYKAEGTQKGEFEGIRPSGKTASWIGADLLRIENDKIVEARFLDDSLGLMRQLGVTIPPPGFISAPNHQPDKHP